VGGLIFSSIVAVEEVIEAVLDPSMSSPLGWKVDKFATWLALVLLFIAVVVVLVEFELLELRKVEKNDSLSSSPAAVLFFDVIDEMELEESFDLVIVSPPPPPPNFDNEAEKRLFIVVAADEACDWAAEEDDGAPEIMSSSLISSTWSMRFWACKSAVLA
jgi:hypothetical protein